MSTEKFCVWLCAVVLLLHVLKGQVQGGADITGVGVCAYVWLSLSGLENFIKGFTNNTA
jgi:hypothetical protein